MINKNDSILILFTLLTVFVVISPIGDVASLLTGVRYSMIIRAVQIILILFLFIRLSNVSAIFVLAISFVAFFIQQIISLIYYDSNQFIFFENILVFLKVISLPLCLYVFVNFHNDEKKIFFSKAIYFTGLVYVIFIPLSFFLGSEFQTYGDSGRFGYKGLIPSANETSILLIVMLYWTLINFLHTKKLRSFSAFIITLLACLMLGTKATLISILFVYFLVFIYKGVSIKLKIIMITMTIVSIFLLFIVYFNQIIIFYDDYMVYFLSKLNSSSLNSYITLLLSGRDTKLFNVIDEINNSISSVLLIGGWPITRYYVEMDLFDLIFFVGFPITLFMLYTFFISIKRLNFSTPSKVLLINLIIIMLTAGHVIFSFVYIPFFVAFLYLLSVNKYVK